MKSCIQIIVFAVLFAAAGFCANPEQDAPDIRPFSDLRGHRETVNAIDFNNDGTMLASAGHEGQVFLWNVNTRRVVRKLFPKEKSITADTLRTNFTRRVEAIEFSPDGKLLAEAAQETNGAGMLRLWNVELGEVTRVLADNVDNLRAIAYSPDGKIVAHNARDTIGFQHKIVFREAATGKELGSMTEANLSATVLAYSPDGKIIASGGGKKVHIWDAEQHKLLHAIDAHEKSVQSICFSPNGKWVVSGSTDDKVKVWNVETGKLELEIKAEQDSVNAVAFSPSGKTIASAGKNRTIKLWKPKSGKQYARLWGHLDRVNCLAYSPADGMLASGSGDSTIDLWKITEPDEVDKDDKGKVDDDEWGEDD